MRLLGELPPVFLLSMWWTSNTLSLDLPLQHWHVWPSLQRTYSLTLLNPSWSPCWYSTPLISGFWIFWISKLAVSTTILLTGNNLWASFTTLKWLLILLSIDGASHPLYFDFTRFWNLCFLYRVFLFLLFRLYCLLVDSLSAMSFRISTSAAYSSFLLVVAETPICLLPASIPRVVSCVYPELPYRSWIVNGSVLLTFAFPCFSSFLALQGLHGIKGLPCLFSTYTTI